MKTLTVEGWRPSAIGHQGPSANVGGCRDRATAPRNIFAIAHCRFDFMPLGTQRRRAIWRMPSAQALIFIAAVAIAVALLLA